MQPVTRVLATTSEICLKGGNRGWFERTLGENVRRALADLRPVRLERSAAQVMVRFAEPIDFEEAARRLGTVFGLDSIQPVADGGTSLETLLDQVDGLVAGLPPTSFAVRCRRSDKGFPLTSPEIERAVGERVVAAQGWPVDLKHPQRTLRVLVERRRLWVWLHRVRGPGGLPIGVGGRALALLSGGIDSPVAAWMTMRRGVRLDFVHFHSAPRTDAAGLEKVRDLVRRLARHQRRTRLVEVPLLPIQELVAARCPPELRLLLYRRFMLRIASRLAHRFRARALVTGDALGQVASQTLDNLAAVGAAVKIPVLRPLLALDKGEIVDRARRIGTYELSIRPHADCCTQLVPEHPETHARARQLEAAEEALDVVGLVGEAVRSARLLDPVAPSPWQDLPLPPEVRS